MAFIPPMLAMAASAAAAAGGAVASGAAAAGTAAMGALGSASTALAAPGMANALGLGSTLMSAGGSLLQGVAGQRAGEFNAKVADMQARQASEQGALAGSEAIRQMNQRVAAGRAASAESGFEATGSVRDLLDQAERGGYMDFLTAVYDGSVRRAGARNDSSVSKSAGSNALWGGVLGAGTAAMSGMSDYYRRTGAIQMTV